ncbi:hypothetical protein [Mycolicibacterium bacteremicum]|uniref:hypothetical protein n=1 Tax=Mycolicibacterium bacteremicum TaxID=564198 RepID=UPI0026E951BC|nr:hypothetical protein [Mycolicibacterium bacteremicum]
MADEAWSELTSGPEPVVRLAADDLQQARRARTRLRDDDGEVAVILDIKVAVAADVRSAYARLDGADGVRYAGTVNGLAGLIADIESAGVADGVTLVNATGAEAATPQDLAELGRTVLGLLEQRNRACA